MARLLHMALSLILAAGFVGSANAQVLLVYEGGTTTLHTVDPSGPSTTLIGSDSAAGIPSEIEAAADGTIYASDTSDNDFLHVIDPATGQVQSTIVMNFPTTGFCEQSPSLSCVDDVACEVGICILSDVITALEFIDGTLYGGFTTEGGPPKPSSLVTIDLGTGDVTVVGATGIESPLGGLAWDESGTTLYGVTAGGSNARLLTVDVGTGAASVVAAVTLDASPIGLTALEFGADDVLYTVPNGNEANVGNLLSIDPMTAVATDLGSLGTLDDAANALTLPEPGAAFSALAVLATLAAVRRQRHRRATR